jgi:hypothetical protein
MTRHRLTVSSHAGTCSCGQWAAGGREHPSVVVQSWQQHKAEATDTVDDQALIPLRATVRPEDIDCVGITVEDLDAEPTPLYTAALAVHEARTGPGPTAA